MSPKLLKDGTVITFDENQKKVKVLPKASILIVGDTISAIEEDVNKISVPSDTEIIDVSNKIVSPGFINTHLHAWQTAYRSIAPDVTLVHYFDWLSQMSKVARTAFTPEDIYISTLEGYLEGLNGGVTSYVDHAHNNWGAEIMKKGFEATVDSGARVWWCYEPFGSEKFPVEEHWKVYEDLSSRPRPDTVALGVSSGMGTQGSEEKLQQTKSMMRKLGVKAITTHHLGGPWPSHLTSPPELEEQGFYSLNIPVILSHAPYLTEKDQNALKDHNMSVSITPESEFHYGHGQTTGHQILPNASLGVDTNFTFSGDILTQARLWLQRTRDVGFSAQLKNTGLLPRTTPMTVEQGFLLATRQGGKALWRDDIGVLKVGAKADIVVFDGSSPNMLGWSNAVAAVMLHANVGDIEHVLVGGELRKRNFKLVGMKMQWEEVKRRFLEAAKRIQSQAFPPPPVTEKLWGFKPTGEGEVFSTIEQ